MSKSIQDNTETLTLPDLMLDYVERTDADFYQTRLTLPDYLASAKTGLIIYFYPKDNTSGCSLQAHDFSEKQTDFAKLGYRIIGVSRDGITAHKKFIENQHIRFGLIADTDEKLCQHFGVIQEKNMYGKKVLGVVRSTFVFDTQGKLMLSQRNVRAKGYAERLLASLQDLPPPNA